MTSAPDTFRARLTAMLGICMTFMLIGYGTSVVGTAMPRIAADLQGYHLYQWGASAYLLGNAIMIPITGRLGDLYGRKPFMLVSVALFALASVACSLAGSMEQFVAARALQGLAGGMVMGVAPACIPDLFPDRMERVRWQALMSTSFGFALAIGPWAGGWFTEHVGWRSVFWINVPLASATLVTTWLFLPRIVQHAGGERRLDWLGALLLMAGTALLLFVTELAPTRGVADPLVLGLALATAVAVVAFFRRQYRTTAPIVPPDVLDNGAARQLMVLGLLIGLTMFTLVFYVPLLLQGSFGYSPADAGVTMSPMLISITVGSIINGRLLPRLRRAERPMAWGQMMMLGGCLALLTVDAGTPRWVVMAILALCGFSLGFQLPNLMIQLMEACGRMHLGVASAMGQTTRVLGSMMGVGLASMLVNSLFGWRVGTALSSLPARDPVLERLLASAQVLIRGEDQLALAERARVLGLQPDALLAAARQGLVDGSRASFVLCALLSGVCLWLSLRLPRLNLRHG